MNLVYTVIFKTIPPCFQVSERILCVHFSFLREVCAHLIRIAVNWKRNGRFEQQVCCSFILCKNTTVTKSFTVLEYLLHFPFNEALGGGLEWTFVS